MPVAVNNVGALVAGELIQLVGLIGVLAAVIEGFGHWRIEIPLVAGLVCWFAGRKIGRA